MISSARVTNLASNTVPARGGTVHDGTFAEPVDSGAEHKLHQRWRISREQWRAGDLRAVKVRGAEEASALFTTSSTPP